MTALRGMAVAVAALALTNCGGDGSDDEVSEPAVPVVSLQTTCDRLFVQDDPALWTQATRLVADESNNASVDTQEADAVAEQLGQIAAASEDAIRPHVEQMQSTVADLDNLDAGDYKLAATEVANQCADYVAADY